MKSRRIFVLDPQTWTGFVLRDVPQTAPIYFCEMVKKLFQHVCFNFICLPELSCGLEHVCGSGKWRRFPSSLWFLKNQHSTVMQPLQSDFGIKQEWWDGANTFAVGLIQEEAGTGGCEYKFQLGKLWPWKINRREGIRRLPAEMEGGDKISAEKKWLIIKGIRTRGSGFKLKGEILIWF